MRVARISRFGERRQADKGLELLKIGVNQYRLQVTADEIPRVFVETLTPDRVATLQPLSPDAFDIFTFNLLNGYHPGSDLVVRVFEEGDKDLLAFASFTAGGVKTENCAAWREGARAIVQPEVAGVVLVQPHSRDFRMSDVLNTSGDAASVKAGDHIQVDTLITRTPPTPLETNIEIAVVRSFGPLFSR